MTMAITMRRYRLVSLDSLHIYAVLKGSLSANQYIMPLNFVQWREEGKLLIDRLFCFASTGCFVGIFPDFFFLVWSFVWQTFISLPNSNTNQTKHRLHITSFIDCMLASCNNAAPNVLTTEAHLIEHAYTLNTCIIKSAYHSHSRVSCFWIRNANKRSNWSPHS